MDVEQNVIPEFQESHFIRPLLDCLSHIRVHDVSDSEKELSIQEKRGDGDCTKTATPHKLCPTKAKGPKDFTPPPKDCMICLKENDHWSIQCPFLIEVPEGAKVGPCAAIVPKWGGFLPEGEGEFFCTICHQKNDHEEEDCPCLKDLPDGASTAARKRKWETRAVLKSCSNCLNAGHWGSECPEESRLARNRKTAKKTPPTLMDTKDMLLKEDPGSERDQKLRDFLDELTDGDIFREHLDMILEENPGQDKEDSLRKFFEDFME